MSASNQNNNQQSTHAAYAVFLSWYEDQRRRELEDFLCWREIQIAKEENDLTNEVEDWREDWLSKGLMEDMIESMCGREAILSHKAEANILRRAGKLRKLMKQRGENSKDHDYRYINKLYYRINPELKSQHQRERKIRERERRFDGNIMYGGRVEELFGGRRLDERMVLRHLTPGDYLEHVKAYVDNRAYIQYLIDRCKNYLARSREPKHYHRRRITVREALLFYSMKR